MTPQERDRFVTLLDNALLALAQARSDDDPELKHIISTFLLDVSRLAKRRAGEDFGQWLQGRLEAAHNDEVAW